jgi:hypothetical protein
VEEAKVDVNVLMAAKEGGYSICPESFDNTLSRQKRLMWYIVY